MRECVDFKSVETTICGAFSSAHKRKLRSVVFGMPLIKQTLSARIFIFLISHHPMGNMIRISVSSSFILTKFFETKKQQPIIFHLTFSVKVNVL